MARGWNVLTLVRQPDSLEARALIRMGPECVRSEITDRKSMGAGMTGADIVVHNAGWYEVGISNTDRTRMHAINVIGTENVLSLALELGMPRTVFVFTVGYYGDTGAEVQDESYRRQAPYRSYYEQTKAKAHEIALQHQQKVRPLITICPAHVVGPNDHSHMAIFSGCM